MNQKLLSEKTAKRLMTYGVVGFVASIVISLATLFNVYGKVGNSGFSNCTANCKTDSLTWQTTITHIAVVLSYISVAAIILGVLMIIVVSAKTKRTQPQTPAQPQPYNPTAVSTPIQATPAQPNRAKHLIIRVLASVAAFFISTSIVVVIVADSVMKASSKTTDQQGHFFAYIIIFVYPLVGGFSAYFTNKYLKKRLG
jgi:hypothetical protein